MPACFERRNPILCSFIRTQNGPIRARAWPDSDDDDEPDWEAMEPTADDLESEPPADVDWWTVDEDEEELPDDFARYDDEDDDE